MAEDPDPSQYLIVSLEQKRKDQTKPYDGKKMVWVPDERECYLLGNIVSTKGDLVTVEVKGEEVSCDIILLFILFEDLKKVETIETISSLGNIIRAFNLLSYSSIPYLSRKSN